MTSLTDFNKTQIFLVPLSRIKKFTAARVRFMKNQRGVSYLLADVLDVVSESEQQLLANDLKLIAPLCGTLVIMSPIKEKGKDSWKYLFDDELKPHEKKIPDVRSQNSLNMSIKDYH